MTTINCLSHLYGSVEKMKFSKGEVVFYRFKVGCKAAYIGVVNEG